MKILIPNYIQKFEIYDVIHNINNELILVKCGPKLNFEIRIYNNDNPPIIYECPYGRTTIYKFTNIDYSETIDIIFNDELIKTKVSTYPNLNNEIIYSTQVRDEDEFIIQWVEYHSKLGVDRFIIYDNSESDTLQYKISEYILKEKVILIKWNHPFNTNSDGLGITGQIMSENQTIYAFPNCKYVGFFNIDEYLNIQEKNTIPNFLEKVIIDQKIDKESISGFQILSKQFHNPYNKPTDGFNFLKIFDCENVKVVGSEKNFIIPKNVITFTVHIVSSGKPIKLIEPNLVFFNHYIFLNKNNRGRDITNLTDDSILKYT
jgi:hypothetical protein